MPRVSASGSAPNWDRLFEVASEQAGYVTNKQAAEAGYSLPLLRLPKGVILHNADLPKAALTWLGPVPLTTPRRAVVDCASADVADDLVRQAVQQGVRRGLFERAEVKDALRRVRRERDAAAKLRKP